MTHTNTDKLYEELEMLYRESVLGGITAWGQGIVKVRANCTAPEWESIYTRLKLRHKIAELEAAIAVGEGRLDPALFPDSITHSKVMQLSTVDQQRLLSNEQFQVYSDDGSGEPVYRTWKAMSPIQHNRLLSPKGGRILTLAEQSPPKGAQPVKVGLYITSSYHSGDGYVTLRNGRREARITLADLADSMGKAAFDAFVHDMNRKFGD